MPPVEKASLVEDFIDIIFAPSKVFARRSTGGAWGPFLIVTVLIVVLAFVNSGAMQGVMDAEVDRAITQAVEQNPSLTEDQTAGMRGMIEGSIKYGAIIFIPVMLLLMGLAIWLIGKMLGGTVSFGLGVMIASYAMVPRVLEQMLVAVQALLLDTASFTSRWQFSLGVGRFMDPSGPQGLLNTIGRIELFTIWSTVLIVLGLAHAAKVTKDKAIIGGALMFVLGGLPALFQMIGGK
jgi:hypothetical protein